MTAVPSRYPRYRLLTGPDDATFCYRVSAALDLGYALYGPPAAALDGGRLSVAQALLWPEGMGEPPHRPATPKRAPGFPEADGAGRASSVIREETPEVRITEWTFGPGASTGHHRHGMDYAIVYLDGGTLHVVSPAGETDVEVRPGMAYFRKAGVEHDVSNPGQAPIRLVEIELKQVPAGQMSGDGVR